MEQPQINNFDWTIITAALFFMMYVVKFLNLNGYQLPIPNRL